MSETALRRQIRLRKWRLALDGSLYAAPGTVAGVESRGGGGGSTGTGRLCETPQQGARLVARLPREEDVTFALGSRGMRMEKGRGAAAAGQPLYIRAGMLRDQPFGGHLPGF